MHFAVSPAHAQRRIARADAVVHVLALVGMIGVMQEIVLPPRSPGPGWP